VKHGTVYNIVMQTDQFILCIDYTGVLLLIITKM